MGLFSGKRPDNLGFQAGAFAPPSWKPNNVCSTVDKTDKHYIAPLAFTAKSADAWKKLAMIIRRSTRATIITETDRYLHAEFKSTGMGFVDDVEFALDGKDSVVHVRSAARLGLRDFDVNRKRVEKIRSEFVAP